MQLLVSVANADEAAAALAGGADIIDAKDPAAGPLGAVEIGVLRQIAAAGAATARYGRASATPPTGRRRARGPCAPRRRARGSSRSASPGTSDPQDAEALLAPRLRRTRGSGGRCGVVAVAYADADAAASLSPDMLVDAAAAAGASASARHGEQERTGVARTGRRSALSAWVARAHQRRLWWPSRAGCSWTISISCARLAPTSPACAAPPATGVVRDESMSRKCARWRTSCDERWRYQPWQSETTQTDRMLRLAGGTSRPRSIISLRMNADVSG